MSQLLLNRLFTFFFYFKLQADADAAHFIYRLERIHLEQKASLELWSSRDVCISEVNPHLPANENRVFPQTMV